MAEDEKRASEIVLERVIRTKKEIVGLLTAKLLLEKRVLQLRKEELLDRRLVDRLLESNS